MHAREFHVYILASRTRTLYVGVTGDIRRRLAQHREGTGSRFTKTYRVHRLVLVETYPDVADALRREKQIKAWRRAKKVALVESVNPEWHDLFDAESLDERRGAVAELATGRDRDPSLRSG